MPTYTIEKYATTTSTDAYTVDITNSHVDLPASAEGVVSSYSNSGTTITVFKGSQELDGTTSSPGAGEFQVTASGTRITPNASPTSSGNPVIYGVASSMSDGNNTASIDFSIDIESALTITKTQTFGKSTGVAGTSAKGIQLILGSNEIHFDNSTGTPSLSPSGTAQDIAVSANLQNISGTPTYTILTAAGSAQTDVIFVGDDHVITTATPSIDASSWDSVSLGESVQIKVELATGGVTYTDTDSVSALFSGQTGGGGAVGLRTANGYLYYNTLQASAPGAPSNSSVQFAFATGLLSGGVIGTGGTDWNQNAPASTGGAASSKMWYVYWSTTEASAGGGTGTTVTLGSTVYNAHNFVGLVRFSGTNTIVDGSGGTISLGSGGTTTIDGDAITTGTVDAARIDTDLLRITGTNFTGEHQGGEVGGWTLASDAIYSGTKDTTGYTGSNGHITICSSGSIHTPAFFVETDGTAGFKGTVTISGTDLTSSNTLNANTVGSDLGGGYGDSSIGGLTLASTKIYIGTGTVNNTNTAFYVDNSGNMSLKDKLYWNGTTLAITGDLKITGSSTTLTETNTLNANTTASNVGLGNVQDLNAQNQAQTGLIAGTTITGGGITLSSGGTIKGGQSAYNNGTGFFLGYESSQYKFSIGNQTNRLTWDGSTMTVQGAITATSGAIGGWNIGGSNTTISATNIELNSTNRYLLISDD